MREKHQTHAQRVANPVWLRDQIGKLVDVIDAVLGENQKLADKLADKERDGPRRALYLGHIESYQHCKRQLERILRGETDNAQQPGVVP